MQHVGGVRGVVVGVGRVVAGLHELQPGAQRRLRAVEELAHAEAREDLQAEVSQRSAEDRTRDQLTGQHMLERRERQIYSMCVSSYFLPTMSRGTVQPLLLYCTLFRTIFQYPASKTLHQAPHWLTSNAPNDFGSDRFISHIHLVKSP